MLKKIYSVPGDQGDIAGGGSVRLVHGSFLAGPGVAAESEHGPTGAVRFRASCGRPKAFA